MNSVLFLNSLMFIFCVFGIHKALATVSEIRGIDVVRNSAVQLNVSTPQKKGTLVTFLSIDCPCSNSHESVLKHLHRQYPNIAFVGIVSNAEESQENIKAHYRDWPFPILKDSSYFYANAFGALKTPHVFLINSDGEEIYRGGIDNSHHVESATKHFLTENLKALSKNIPLPYPKTRPIGCLIRG